MHCQFCTRVSHETLLRKSSLCHLSTFRSRITVATSDTGDFQNRQIHITQATAQVEKCTNMLKYERGRVQTDGEYKLLILLIYLSRTIEWETIKNHMHHAGSHPNPNRIWVSHLPWPDCSKPSILGLGQSQYLGGLRSLPMSLSSIVQAGRPPTRSVFKYNMFASNVLRILHR